MPTRAIQARDTLGKIYCHTILACTAQHQELFSETALADLQRLRQAVAEIDQVAKVTSILPDHQIVLPMLDKKRT